MKNLIALTALALVAGCYTSPEPPDDCEITTTTSVVECEREENGRYACECGPDGVSGTFVSDDFCDVDADEQDVQAEAGCDVERDDENGTPDDEPEPTFNG